MNPREIPSTEPQHLVGVPKTCPRADCPNPTIGTVWKGSVKQLQYHCFGCWRKFNYGGVLRSWAKQVAPPNWWLRRYAPDLKKAPELLKLQPPPQPGPIRKRTHKRLSRRSVAESASAEDLTTKAMHPGESSIRTRGSNDVNHLVNEEGPTVATSGEEHGTGIAGPSALPVMDVDITKSNGLGDEEAPCDPGTQTSPTSENTTDMMNNLDNILGEEDIDADGVWKSFKSPKPYALWGYEVRDDAQIVSLDDNGNDDNPTIAQQGVSGVTTGPFGGATTQPRRQRSMTITFGRFSVPSKTIYYDLQD